MKANKKRAKRPTLKEIQNKKLLAEINDNIAKARADDDLRVMQELTSYFTEKLVPVKPPVTYKDLDDLWDGQPVPVTRINDGPAYQMQVHRIDKVVEADDNGKEHIRYPRTLVGLRQYDVSGKYIPDKTVVAKKEPGLVESLISMFNWIYNRITHGK